MQTKNHFFAEKLVFVKKMSYLCTLFRAVERPDTFSDHADTG